MIKVRNNWAHNGSVSDKDVVLHDLDTVLAFLENVIMTNKYTQSIYEFRNEVENADFSAVFDEAPVVVKTPETTLISSDEIKEKDRVYLTSDPNTKGMVFSIEDVNGTLKYEVFVDGEIKTFYAGQIQKIDSTPTYQWVDLATLQTNLTAYEINNPSAGNLYSLNAARIDFVPYQFRPALKLIKSDEPKILIADSVGVGKTIEAGLIVKELEARSELDNILIICPKPLVAERKWELEMKRFDEEFIPLDGLTLRQAISNTHRDEEWPIRYNKAIIPYSILDSRVYEGEAHGRYKQYGLLDLDPALHFDLVIVDEAHHIRNGSLEKEKAYAYKCVRYFCEHSDAVVMLTATPLQTSNDDLFTLMNLLRPDVIMDKEVFNMMSRPNEFIYKCSHAIRGASKGWREEAITELQNIKSTQWGENIVAQNPMYASVIERLAKTDITRDERVKLVSDVESLHSFNTMLNRTRRRDIQDFCIRRSYTVETSFTQQQYDLHNELLKFEYESLSKLHNVRSIPFMMSTIRRQAASCVFGLAPYIRDLITRRFDQMVDNPDIDMDEYDLDAKASSTLVALAHHILELADLLPEVDPKFDSILKIVTEKQTLDNNKIILFSSFRHTLSYTHGTYDTGSRGKHPEWWTSGEFRWRLSADALKEALRYITEHPTAKDTPLKSQTIMKLLVLNEQRLCGMVHIGGSTPNLENEPCEMIRILRGERMFDWNGKWVFTESGELVAPKMISKYDISVSIYGRIKADSIIFDLLRFKKTEADEVDELKKNVPHEKLEAYFESELRQRYGISSADLNERYGSNSSFETVEEEIKLPFPSLNIKNLEALKKHAAEMLIFANPVKYENRIRSIRVSNPTREIKAYLSSMYRHEGVYKYACQLCHETCSSFESAEIFLEAQKELDPIHLCLCPNCATVYRKLRSDSTLMSSLKNKILSKSEQDIKLDDHVAVAIDDDDELWFTQTHFAEIQELLRLIDEVKNRKTTVTKQLSADNEGEKSGLSVYSEFIGKNIQRKDGFVGTVTDITMSGNDAYLKVHVIGGKDAGKDTSIQLSFLLKNKGIYSIAD